MRIKHERSPIEFTPTARPRGRSPEAVTATRGRGRPRATIELHTDRQTRGRPRGRQAVTPPAQPLARLRTHPASRDTERARYAIARNSYAPRLG